MKIHGYVAINDETRFLDYVNLRLGGGDFITHIISYVDKWDDLFEMAAGKDKLRFKLERNMTASDAVLVFERRIANLEWVQRRIKNNFKVKRVKV